MPKIRTPPPFNQLQQELDPKNFVPLLMKYGAVDANGRYLHWHEFQWRVEASDQKTAAWLVTKLNRHSIAKKLDLLQAENHQCFSYCVPDSLFAQLHGIDKMTGGGHKISDDIFDSAQVKNQSAITNSDFDSRAGNIGK